jgi:NAD(P)-dependent dehydrogenase (short-subunit alcohol dehydrogenase family)
MTSNLLASTLPHNAGRTSTAQRSILITGCSSGIGYASAVGLKARGWRVLATARKPADLARLATAVGVEALDLELADPASIAACADAALARTGGRLTALFSNAAYGQIGAVEDLTPDVLRRQFEVNVIGLHDLTRRLIPAMRRNGTGRIVQCSSVLGLMAQPYRGAYCASKFALEGLTDALRMELHGSGIHVSLIEPGPIRTRFLDTALATLRASIDIDVSWHAQIYKRRLAAMEAGGKTTFKLEPEAVTRRLIHALESSRPKARYFVTTPTYAAAFLKRVLPTVLLDRVARTQ